VEQDHRAIKRRVNASQGFRSFDGAWRTIQGYEALHMIRKGQVRWLPKGDVLGQIQFIREILGLKTEEFDRRELAIGSVSPNCFCNTTVVRTIEASEPAGRRVPPMEGLRVSVEAIRVIAAAREIAHTAGRDIAPADLARGILCEANTLAARLLREHISDRA
jgi:translation elongation factor EF-Tu-like GTPase